MSKVRRQARGIFSGAKRRTSHRSSQKQEGKGDGRSHDRPSEHRHASPGPFAQGTGTSQPSKGGTRLKGWNAAQTPRSGAGGANSVPL
jgi:hypothetical protein